MAPVVRVSAWAGGGARVGWCLAGKAAQPIWCMGFCWGPPIRKSWTGCSVQVQGVLLPLKQVMLLRVRTGGFWSMAFCLILRPTGGCEGGWVHGVWVLTAVRGRCAASMGP